MKYVKIKKIKNVETEPIYHVTVKNNHNFFGNGICLHNCDYYSNPDNDGNIIIALYNYGTKIETIEKDERVMQGIFTNFNITTDDNEKILLKQRNGGVGSTGKK